LALNGIVADGAGSSNTHAQFGYTAGSIGWNGREWTISADTAPAAVPVYYRSASAGLWFRYTATNYPLRQYLGSGSNRMSYNYFNGTTWTEANTTANSYVCSTILFATNDSNNPVIAVQGRNENPHYASSDLQHGDVALEDALSIVSDSTFPFDIAIPLGALVFETDTAYTNAVNSRVISISGSDYCDLRYFARDQKYYTGKLEFVSTTSTSFQTYKRIDIDDMDPGFYRITGSYIWRYPDSASRTSTTDAEIVGILSDIDTMSSAYFRSSYYGYNVEYPQQSMEAKVYVSAGSHYWVIGIQNYGSGGYTSWIQQGRIMVERMI
jgi:hypothetical protein